MLGNKTYLVVEHYLGTGVFIANQQRLLGLGSRRAQCVTISVDQPQIY